MKESSHGRTVEAVLSYLPSIGHKSVCRQVYDRECGFCDCGYEAATELKKLIWPSRG